MLSVELYFAFLGIGAAFVLWGSDKILEVFPSRINRFLKAFLGFTALIVGAIIVVLIFSVGHTSP